MRRRRYRYPALRKLTATELERLRWVNAALDAATEFSVETASREVVQQRLAIAINALRVPKESM